ncbi:fungal-specific transcription factor [Mariannaea sp. PMI_226]|nr:fungal-specific transcription factor [Mariannaea sp. PMI_226]
MSNHSRSPLPARKVERSCLVCHRRKVRCDKQSPCSQCARGGYSCFYPQAGPPARRVRKTTMTDVASRITELEKTLIAVSREHDVQLRSTASPSTPSQSSAPPTDPEFDDKSQNQEGILFKKGSTSQYFNEVLLSHVIEHEHDVRSVLSTPKSRSSQMPASSPFSVAGILSARCLDEPLTNYLPSKTTAMKLWGAYLEAVDSSSKVLHIPTDEITIFTAIDDPSRASTETLALCFSIYFAGTLALDSADMLGLPKDQFYETLHRFKHGLEQAFALAEFLENPTVVLLQALAIYLVALRVNNTGRGIWTLNGLAIRAAQSIGLHRDGRVLNLSPFEAEIRRRLWWRLLSLDGRAAEDYGLQNISDHNLISGVDLRGVDLPLNIEDTDIYPEIKELPPARPGYTRMTVPLVSIEVARAWSQILNAASPTGAAREVFRKRVVKEAMSKMADILARCNTVLPQQRMAAGVSRFVLRKLDVVSRQRDALNHVSSDNSQTMASEEYFLEAVSILEEADQLWSDELLRPYRWSMHAYRQFQMMLYIVWYLCMCPHSPHSDRALRAVQSHVSQSQKLDDGAPHESKWVVILALQAKATAMVEQAKKMSDLPPNGAPPTPQDADDGMGLVVWNRGADGNGEQDGHVPQGLLDWRTLLQDFQLDPSNLSIV